MGILIGFLPWLIYGVLLSLGHLKIAIAIPLAFMLLAGRQDLWGAHLKVLSLGTFSFLVAMLGAAFFVPPDRLSPWLPVLSHSALLLITLVSILIGKPFTIEYAREEVPQERWNTPRFLRVNYVLTFGWLLAFFIMTILPTAKLLGWHVHPLIYGLVSLGTMTAAYVFTGWYKKKK